MDAVAPAIAGISQLICWNAGLDGPVLERAVALFFGEKIATVGDDKSHVAGASLIDSRKINFIENSVAQREPDFALLVECGADAGLGAGCPTRRDSRPAGSKA